MIFLKNGESFIRVNDWSEIQARESYYPKLELNDQQLSDVLVTMMTYQRKFHVENQIAAKGIKRDFW